jgi:uncharacterized protein YdhG (YjbR/CyaY superfamily)
LKTVSAGLAAPLADAAAATTAREVADLLVDLHEHQSPDQLRRRLLQRRAGVGLHPVGKSLRREPLTKEVLHVATKPTVGSVDEYRAQLPPAAREALDQLRAIITELAPDASETISYGIPAYDLGGRHLVFIAGRARHVSLYPPPHDLAAFEQELHAYKTGKGSVQFPLNRPLPVDLVRRLVAVMVSERGGEAAG